MKVILTEAQYQNFNTILDINSILKSENIFINEGQINHASKLLLNNNLNGFYNYLFEANLFDIVQESCLLSFSTENSKLHDMLIFSLPAGWSCPFADKCMKKVKRDRVFDPEKIGTVDKKGKTYIGKVEWERGKNTEFDCFAANQELQYDEVRALRWSNYDLLLNTEKTSGVNGMYQLIKKSIEFAFDETGKKDEVRIHESGDFYNQKYLDAWVMVAKSMPDILFYAYSKSIPYFRKYMSPDDQGNNTLMLSNNFIVTFSEGGRLDKELETLNVKSSKVFKSPEEILAAGMKVDLDDTLAKLAGNKASSFALLLHGTQDKGINSLAKMRNETFLNYWKYRPYLNRLFSKTKENVWSSVEAKPLLQQIDAELSNPKSTIKKSRLKFLKTQMNYINKYENYKFPIELIEIVPNEYQP